MPGGRSARPGSAWASCSSSPGSVETGSEGKALLEAGGVEVDGEVETRRGRQLHHGALVTARDQAVRVLLPAG